MKAILLLHGALGAKSQLEPIRETLEQKGHVVYSINFSGHNGIPFNENGFGIDVFAADVLNLMEQHQLDTVDIFGYSMGGYVALWLAHRSPARVGEIITLGTKFDWDPASARREVAKMDPDKILDKVPAFARILEHRHAPNDWRELLRRTADMMTGLGEAPLLTNEILRSIHHPVTVYLGDRDDMADRTYSEQVASMLPNGKFILLDNTPHPIEKVAFVPFA
jgi:pimeloyl-ACP methyl ester carboxylesterase